MSEAALAGCRVLVVEDEALVCMILEDMLLDIGCEVIGTAARLDEALSLAQYGQFDAAVLDVNLDGEKSYPVADVLIERGVPFVFSTGYDRLQNGYDNLPRLQKPFKQKELAMSLASALTDRGSAGRLAKAAEPRPMSERGSGPRSIKR